MTKRITQPQDRVDLPKTKKGMLFQTSGVQGYVTKKSLQTPLAWGDEGEDKHKTMETSTAAGKITSYC